MGDSLTGSLSSPGGIRFAAVVCTESTASSFSEVLWEVTERLLDNEVYFLTTAAAQLFEAMHPGSKLRFPPLP